MSSISKLPKLPHMDDGEATSLRHEVNPAIALNTLTDIYKKVQQYQIQLRQLTQKVHQVYAEGPIVSGWLASEASLNAAVRYSRSGNGDAEPWATNANDSNHINHSHNNGHGERHTEAQTKPFQAMGSADVALFRHGDTHDLMNYLSALESAVLETGKAANKSSVADHASITSTIDPSLLEKESQTEPSIENNGNPSQYYLCRLTSCGQIQTEPCPPDQVPVLSMAIARYRRLNQIIKQKQTIETKLQTIVEILEDIETVLAD